jgi:hypothetical protein
VSRITLHLPETLHRHLTERAQKEGVSLQDYIVYSLTRMATASDLTEQREAFGKLLTQYPQEQAEAALREILSSRE